MEDFASRAYFGKCAYFGCAYYELGRYMILPIVKINSIFNVFSEIFLIKSVGVFKSVALIDDD